MSRGDVTLEADTLDGAPGLWVHPADGRSGEAIVHLHDAGGRFNFGSANTAAREARRSFPSA
jgi:epsilon-lactone hydrolase